MPLDTNDEGTIGSAWIGRGCEGIHAWARDVTPGPPCDADLQIQISAFRPPKLLQSPRRPVPPTLSISGPSATVAEPSRPIGTRSPPRQPSSPPSLATLSTTTTNTSMVSLPTPASSISVGVAVPSKDVDGLHGPSVFVHNHTHATHLVHKLTAHLRSWAASASQKDVNTRSETVTRTRGRPTRDDSALRGPAASEIGYTNSNMNANVVNKPMRRARSPICLFLPDEDIRYAKVSKEMMSCAEKEKVEWYSSQTHTPSTHRTSPEDDHPVFRSRGRKVSRVAS